jgi:CDP-paratose 2-epimerase
MKIAISGVSGFIGSHAAARFLQMGHRIVGFDNLSRPGSTLNLQWLEEISGDLQILHVDLRSANDVESVFSKHSDVQLVLHEAAQVAVTSSVVNPRHDFEVNALGTFNMLESVRKHCPDASFFYASTNKVYGALDRIEVVERDGRYGYKTNVSGVDESEALDFHSPYGCSKGAADQYVRDYSRIYGMKTVVFRQSCIYGTRQFGVEDQGWVAWFTIAAVLGKPVTIYGDGKQVRDVLWVDDLIDLYCSALDHIDVASGQIYNAGGGPVFTLSLLQLLEMLGAALNKSVSFNFADWRPGDQQIFVAKCEKAKRELCWAPKISPSVGVNRLVQWVLNSRAVLERTNA